MKTIPAALQTHLEQTTTTLCFCCIITRTDSVIKRFTDLDVDVVRSEGTYESAIGYTASSIKNNSNLSVGNFELFGIVDSAGLDPDDLRAGLYDYAKMEFFKINYLDPDAGEIPIKYGYLGEVELLDDTSFKVEFRDLTQALQQTIGSYYTASCRVALYSTACGVDAVTGGFTHTGSVTTAFETDNRRVFDSTDLLQDTGYFNGGTLTWTSGNNNQRQMEIKKHEKLTTPDRARIELFLPMPENIIQTDNFSAVAGCDKTKDTCITKFNNVVNFRGFAEVPGSKEIMRYGGQ